MLIARVLAYVRRAASDSWILSGDFIIFFVRLEPADWVVRAKRRGPPSVTTNHRVCWPSPTVEGKKFESFRSSFAVVHQEASTDALWTLAAGRNANREKLCIWQLTFFLYDRFFGWCSAGISELYVELEHFILLLLCFLSQSASAWVNLNWRRSLLRRKRNSGYTGLIVQ